MAEVYLFGSLQCLELSQRDLYLYETCAVTTLTCGKVKKTLMLTLKENNPVLILRNKPVCKIKYRVTKYNQKLVSTIVG